MPEQRGGRPIAASQRPTGGDKAIATGKKGNSNDVYAAGLWASTRAEKERIFRAGIDEAIEPLHHVLDMKPKHARGRLLLASMLRLHHDGPNLPVLG